MEELPLIPRDTLLELSLPKFNLESIDLDRKLSDWDLAQIIAWAEPGLKDHPNEPMELLSGNTTILWIYINGREEQQSALAFNPWSKEWESFRERVRWYGRRFAKALAMHINLGRFHQLTTLCFNGWGELVKNTFDHADGTSISIAITRENGSCYFIYRDYLEEGNVWMLWRFRNNVARIPDSEIMQHLLNPGISTKSRPNVNCWLGIWLICWGLRWGWLNVSIHTDGQEFVIQNSGMNFKMKSSHMPAGIWYIATPKN